jgi:tetratricopeptide (TPR) repeat protein
MSKKKSKKRRRTSRKSRPVSTVPRRLLEELPAVDDLLHRKRWAEARDTLVQLDRRYRGQPEVLRRLADVYLDLQDMEGYQEIAERLVRLEPENAEPVLGLASAYLATARPMLSLRTFRTFVDRWPDHESAAEAHETIARLEEALPQLYAQIGVDDIETAWPIALLHEEMQVCLAQGQFSGVRRAAKEILRERPEFTPALNNLSLAHWAEGRLDQAVEAAQKVLTFEPDNVHALANLVHFCCLNGRTEQAQDYAERLRASPAPASEKPVKQMEAFAYLGDDEAVLALFDQAAGTQARDERFANPMVYHLAAVAMLRQGHEKRARQTWKQALKIRPGFDLARENLEDLDLAVSERHGPWPFPSGNWLGQSAMRDLESLVERIVAKKKDGQISSAVRRYMLKYPQVKAVLPFLLEQGDPFGRGMAVALIHMADRPELWETLKSFALGPHGPDALRLEAANSLSQQGVLPGGQTRMYVQGELQGMLLIGFQVGDESEDEENFPRQVAKLAEEATLALYDNDGQRAEQLLKKALAVRPDSPSLLNNLAGAYQMQGRKEAALDLVREIHERHPDYLFARISIAALAIKDNDFDRAHDLLDPLLRRKKLHFSEFSRLCSTLIDLSLAEGNRDAARSWFEMWESADPDSPNLEAYRLRVGGLIGALGHLLGR